MQRLSESQRSFLRAATERYRRSMEGSPADEYLATRGLAFPSIKPEMDKFLLGYVDDPLPGHEMFRGNLAIPYLRWSQELGWAVVSIRFRCIENHDHTGHGKYMTLAGDKPRLYNTLALLKQSPVIAITEGEIDAMTAQVCGIPTVGVPGATSWKPHFREPFLGYREVFILADGDEPGMTFANTVAKTMPNAKVIPCPPGEDVNSLVIGSGPQALMSRLT
ncbi:DNA primase [Mycobacterium phage MyraDee]|uniref:DNA primase n=1 Tax=Mycobacterium phage MyraDee TaxID=2024303 RepID=A0A222YY01_9CAUD|nr:DNA primase [Mycobacterium phage MyraDee]ASR77161.1 DNA primase [Mycobacterium phage MyraDee]